MEENKKFIKLIKEQFPFDINTMMVSGADISELNSEKRRWVLMTLTQDEREISKQGFEDFNGYF